MISRLNGWLRSGKSSNLGSPTLFSQIYRKCKKCWWRSRYVDLLGDKKTVVSLRVVVGWDLWGASLVAQTVKNLPAMQKTWARSLYQENPLEKGMSTLSSILAWKVPWTKEFGGLQVYRDLWSFFFYTQGHCPHLTFFICTVFIFLKAEHPSA